MADNSIQIDELKLDITVEDKTGNGGSSKKVNALATAISRLDKVIQGFDTTKMSGVFSKLTSAIKPFVSSLKSVSKEIVALNSMISKVGMDKLKTETPNVKVDKQEAPSINTDNISNLNDKLSQLNSKYIELQKEGKNTAKVQGQIKNVTKELSKETETQAKTSEKSSGAIAKFTRSLGRVAFYRSIRFVLKEITQAFRESISGIAKYNSEFQGTMSSLVTSMDKAKTSIGVSLYQTLIVLEPVITSLANGIVTLANSLSKVTAVLRGSATYTKINTEYMKEYEKATKGALLSFDTFTTLQSNSNGIDYSKMLETLETPIDTSNFTKLEKVMIGIYDVIVVIADAMKWTIDKIVKSFKWLIQAAKDVARVIGDVFHILMVSITNVGKFFVNLVIGFINLIIEAINVLLLPIHAIAKLFGKSFQLQTYSYVEYSKFAKGGMLEGAGTMYAVAGEAGAEVVATSSSGTGVLNVEQFTDAMVNALLRYGAARDGGTGANIILDGNKIGSYVASNNGFKNEANRRNVGLNWK